MFKQVMTHEILPGKLPEVKKWLQGNYDELRKKDPNFKGPNHPDYKGPRQYITVYGSANQLVIELDLEKPMEISYAEATHNEGLIPLIVPGRTVVQLLKKLEFE